jgi:hypothetical protein
MTQWMKRGDRKRHLSDLESDIQNHIEIETQDNIARGMSPEEARYAAMRKFGNVTRVMEDTREVWAITWLDHLVQDLRFALRGIRKSPLFATVVVLTLALGIGANTAIFTIIDSVMLRAIPVSNPRDLFVFSWKARNDPDYTGRSSYADRSSSARCPCRFFVRFWRRHPILSPAPLRSQVRCLSTSVATPMLPSCKARMSLAISFR